MPADGGFVIPGRLDKLDEVLPLKVCSDGIIGLKTAIENAPGSSCTTMKAKDVTSTLELALETVACDHAIVVNKLRSHGTVGSKRKSGAITPAIKRYRSEIVCCPPTANEPLAQ